MHEVEGGDQLRCEQLGVALADAAVGDVAGQVAELGVLLSEDEHIRRTECHVIGGDDAPVWAQEVTVGDTHTHTDGVRGSR